MDKRESKVTSIITLRLEIMQIEKIKRLDKISYKKFGELYQKYGSNMSEEQFSMSVLGISLQELDKIKQDPEGETEVFTNSGMLTDDDIRRRRLTIVEEYFFHQNDEITYDEFQKIYNRFNVVYIKEGGKRYRGILNDVAFAEQILGMSREDLGAMKKDDNVRRPIFRKCAVGPEDVRDAREAFLKDNGMEGINTTSFNIGYFFELYRKYVTILGPKNFALHVLRLTEEEYEGIVEGNKSLSTRMKAKLKKDGSDEITLTTKYRYPQRFIKYWLGIPCIEEKLDIQPPDVDFLVITSKESDKKENDAPPYKSAVYKGPIFGPDKPMPDQKTIDEAKRITENNAERLQRYIEWREKVLGTPPGEKDEKPPSHTEKNTPQPITSNTLPPKARDTPPQKVRDTPPSAIKVKRRTISKAQLETLRNQAETIYLKQIGTRLLNESDINKIREYVDAAFLSFSENTFFSKAKDEENSDKLDEIETYLKMIPIKEQDVVNFSKMAVSIGKHNKAIAFISYGEDTANIDFAGAERLEKLKRSVNYAKSRMAAINLVYRDGVTNSVEICRRTGLPVNEALALIRRKDAGNGIPVTNNGKILLFEEK